MIGDPLFDLIRQQVKDEAKTYLKGEDELNAIWAALMSALQVWKLQHGNPKPIDGSTVGGLLGGNPKRITFTKATPWQCTGNPFESVISLTLRLLHENFAEVVGVRTAASESKLMAALLIRGGDGYSWDWFFAYRNLMHSQLPEARKAGAMAVFLEHWDDLKAQQRHKASQSARAKAPRKKEITKEKLEQYRAKFHKENGKLQGWKKCACLEYNVDLKTLNKRMQE